jgi:hypothetical protein
MQEVGIFLSLAAIAGVFVGFGALIAIRSGGALAIDEVAYMRAVVAMGMLTVVAALAPVSLARFDLGGHEVWALSSATVLVGWFVVVVAMARTPEYRMNMAAELEADRASWRSPWRMVGSAAVVLYLVTMLLVPVVVILGVAPDLEAALYFATVVLILLGAAWTLLTLVFAQRHPASE